MSTLEFDPESLTVGELCDLHDVAGDTATTELAKGAVSPKVLLGLTWIIRRRDDPTFTIEQARDIKVADIQFGDSNGNGPEA